MYTAAEDLKKNENLFHVPYLLDDSANRCAWKYLEVTLNQRCPGDAEAPEEFKASRNTARI